MFGVQGWDLLMGFCSIPHSDIDEPRQKCIFPASFTHTGRLVSSSIIFRVSD